MARNAVAIEVERREGKLGAGEYFLTGDDKNNPAGMWHGCPCGCGLRSYLPFSDGFWIIDVPFPKASLRPSIGMFAGQTPFHWHGFLRAGVFEEC